MRYEEPEIQILLMSQYDVVCEASAGGGIQEGGDLPGIGEDTGDYT